MKTSLVNVALILVAIVVAGGTYASDNAVSEPAKAKKLTGLKAAQERQERLIRRDEKHQAAAARKLVDINNADREELKTLQGIGDPEAVRIIAGRPYGSKAWLVSRQVINPAIYESIKRKIVAGKIDGDPAKNSAPIDKKK